MFKVKFFASLSTLSFMLSASPLLAGQLDVGLMLDVEKTAIRKAKAVTKEDRQLETFTYTGRTLVKGEVPGDGTCGLHTLAVLYPEKKISREEFINRLRLAVHKDNPESKQMREELA